MKKRSTFTGGFGFVMAAASSAIGLGNIWRFPYLAAKYGGSAFLIVYIILVLTFGFSLMIAENVIGRKTGKGPLVAYGDISKKWSFVGVLATLVPVLIFPYYNLIGGWVLNYTAGYLSGSCATMAEDSYFTDLLANPAKLFVVELIFTAGVTAVIMCGVQKGIERFSKLLMPILLILAVAISVYSITLPGAIEGVKYFFVPSMERFSLQGVLAAMGQMFFSLSLAMGIMIAYGSYLPKDADIEKSVTQIEFFDTLIAILAGLMIIPAVFAFSGGDESALGKGPGLMFITLPKVFASMGGTRLAGSLFFLLVLFAAITSSMSVMEAIVSSICDRFGMSRKKAALLTGIWGQAVGTLCILGYSVLSGVKFGSMDILDTLDFLTNSVLMPVTALLTCIFVGYVFGIDNVKAEITLSGKFRREKIFTVMIKYIAPVLIVAILISSILDSMGIIKF
ncbi:MAG: sodium-dependent transporter [Candidatus Ornithomonoglobus sp.]